jgi:hypothetical protein
MSADAAISVDAIKEKIAGRKPNKAFQVFNKVADVLTAVRGSGIDAIGGAAGSLTGAFAENLQNSEFAKDLVDGWKHSGRKWALDRERELPLWGKGKSSGDAALDKLDALMQTPGISLEEVLAVLTTGDISVDNINFLAQTAALDSSRVLRIFDEIASNRVSILNEAVMKTVGANNEYAVVKKLYEAAERMTINPDPAAIRQKFQQLLAQLIALGRTGNQTVNLLHAFATNNRDTTVNYIENVLLAHDLGDAEELEGVIGMLKIGKRVNPVLLAKILKQGDRNDQVFKDARVLELGGAIGDNLSVRRATRTIVNLFTTLAVGPALFNSVAGGAVGAAASAAGVKVSGLNLYSALMSFDTLRKSPEQAAKVQELISKAVEIAPDTTELKLDDLVIDLDPSSGVPLKQQIEQRLTELGLPAYNPFIWEELRKQNKGKVQSDMKDMLMTIGALSASFTMTGLARAADSFTPEEARGYMPAIINTAIREAAANFVSPDDNKSFLGRTLALWALGSGLMMTLQTSANVAAGVQAIANHLHNPQLSEDGTELYFDAPIDEDFDDENEEQILLREHKTASFAFKANGTLTSLGEFGNPESNPVDLVTISEDEISVSSSDRGKVTTITAKLHGDDDKRYYRQGLEEQEIPPAGEVVISTSSATRNWDLNVDGESRVVNEITVGSETFWIDDNTVNGNEQAGIFNISGGGEAHLVYSAEGDSGQIVGIYIEGSNEIIPISSAVDPDPTDNIDVFSANIGGMHYDMYFTDGVLARVEGPDDVPTWVNTSISQDSLVSSLIVDPVEEISLTGEAQEIEFDDEAMTDWVNEYPNSEEAVAERTAIATNVQQTTMWLTGGDSIIDEDRADVFRAVMNLPEDAPITEQQIIEFATVMEFPFTERDDAPNTLLASVDLADPATLALAQERVDRAYRDRPDLFADETIPYYGATSFFEIEPIEVEAPQEEPEPQPEEPLELEEEREQEQPEDQQFDEEPEAQLTEPAEEDPVVSPSPEEPEEPIATETPIVAETERAPIETEVSTESSPQPTASATPSPTFTPTPSPTFTPTLEPTFAPELTTEATEDVDLPNEANIFDVRPSGGDRDINGSDVVTIGDERYLMFRQEDGEAALYLLDQTDFVNDSFESNEISFTELDDPSRVRSLEEAGLETYTLPELGTSNLVSINELLINTSTGETISAAAFIDGQRYFIVDIDSSVGLNYQLYSDTEAGPILVSNTLQDPNLRNDEVDGIITSQGYIVLDGRVYNQAGGDQLGVITNIGDERLIFRADRDLIIRFTQTGEGVYINVVNNQFSFEGTLYEINPVTGEIVPAPEATPEFTPEPEAEIALSTDNAIDLPSVNDPDNSLFNRQDIVHFNGLDYAMFEAPDGTIVFYQLQEGDFTAEGNIDFTELDRSRVQSAEEIGLSVHSSNAEGTDSIEFISVNNLLLNYHSGEVVGRSLFITVDSQRTEFLALTEGDQNLLYSFNPETQELLLVADTLGDLSVPDSEVDGIISLPTGSSNTVEYIVVDGRVYDDAVTTRQEENIIVSVGSERMIFFPMLEGSGTLMLYTRVIPGDTSTIQNIPVRNGEFELDGSRYSIDPETGVITLLEAMPEQTPEATEVQVEAPLFDSALPELFAALEAQPDRQDVAEFALITIEGQEYRIEPVTGFVYTENGDVYGRIIEVDNTQVLLIEEGSEVQTLRQNGTIFDYSDYITTDATVNADGLIDTSQPNIDYTIIVDENGIYHFNTLVTVEDATYVINRYRTRLSEVLEVPSDLQEEYPQGIFIIDGTPHRLNGTELVLMLNPRDGIFELAEGVQGAILQNGDDFELVILNETTSLELFQYEGLTFYILNEEGSYRAFNSGRSQIDEAVELDANGNYIVDYQEQRYLINVETGSISLLNAPAPEAPAEITPPAPEAGLPSATNIIAIDGVPIQDNATLAAEALITVNGEQFLLFLLEGGEFGLYRIENDNYVNDDPSTGMIEIGSLTDASHVERLSEFALPFIPLEGVNIGMITDDRVINIETYEEVGRHLQIGASDVIALENATGGYDLWQWDPVTNAMTALIDNLDDATLPSRQLIGVLPGVNAIIARGEVYNFEGEDIGMVVTIEGEHFAYIEGRDELVSCADGLNRTIQIEADGSFSFEGEDYIFNFADGTYSLAAEAPEATSESTAQAPEAANVYADDADTVVIPINAQIRPEIFEELVELGQLTAEQINDDSKDHWRVLANTEEGIILIDTQTNVVYRTGDSADMIAVVGRYIDIDDDPLNHNGIIVRDDIAGSANNFVLMENGQPVAGIDNAIYVYEESQNIIHPIDNSNFFIDLDSSPLTLTIIGTNEQAYEIDISGEGHFQLILGLGNSTVELIDGFGYVLRLPSGVVGPHRDSILFIGQDINNLAFQELTFHATMNIAGTVYVFDYIIDGDVGEVEVWNNPEAEIVQYTGYTGNGDAVVFFRVNDQGYFLADGTQLGSVVGGSNYEYVSDLNGNIWLVTDTAIELREPAPEVTPEPQGN